MGFPAGGLIEARHSASSIVTGSRGHRTATGPVLGSVSERFTDHAGDRLVVIPEGAVVEHDR